MAGSVHPSLLLCPTLVGRSAEITMLQALIQRVQGGQGQVALLAGEAGIGKSRLVTEVRTEASRLGFLFLQGNCFQADHLFPYAPLLDLLRTYLHTHAATAAADLQSLAPALARLLPDLPLLLPELAPISVLPALDPEQEKHRLFGVLMHFFIRQAEQHPTLLVIEDIHWCDETSREFLLHLAHRCSQMSLLLLCTYRSEECSPSVQHFLAELHRERLTQQITLLPLSRDEVGAMLSAMGSPLPADLLERFLLLAEGRPFFVEELLSTSFTTALTRMQEEGGSRGEYNDVPGHFPLPPSVQDAVRRRTEHLSAEARHALILAAVAGRRFNFAVLQHVLGCEEAHLVGLMEELIAAQLVVEELAEQFAFRHALTREAIYEGLLARERRMLHQTIAEALEALAPTSALREAYQADLAAHCYAAELWEKALQYGQSVGEQALALYAPRAAVAHVTEALDAAHQLAMTPPASLHWLRGQGYDALGAFERAQSDYEQALYLARSSGDRMMEWQCLLDLGMLWTGRDYAQAGPWFRQALKLAEQLASSPQRARSLNRLGNWLVNVGQTGEGLGMHHEALALFKELREQQGMAETLDLLGVGYGLHGDVVNSVRFYERSVELLRASGDLRALSSSLSTLSSFSSPCLTETTFSVLSTKDVCLRHATEALQYATQADWSAGQAFAEITACHALLAFGDFSAALAHGQRALHLATDIAHQQWMAGAYYVTTHTYVLLLAPHLALQHAEAGLALARSSGSSYWINSIATYHALALLQRKELAEAEALLSTVLLPEREPHSLGDRRVAWVWGELFLQQSKPMQALERAESLLASAPGGEESRSQPIPALLKLKGEALLALSRLDEAIVALEGAKEGAEMRQEPSLLWQVHRSLGQVYRLHNTHQPKD